MRPVQFILMLIVLGMLLLYFSRLRSGVLDRLVILTFGILGIVMVAVPDITTKLANMVGVGRGSDLFTYLSLLGIAFTFMLLYSKIRDLEASLTSLTRTLAISRAHKPGDTDDSQKSG